MTRARGIRYLDEGGLQVIEVDVPDPGHGEVQVQGGACGICAWDLYTFAHGAKAPSAAPPGHEGVGRVIKEGPGVTGLKEGDRVTGGGFFSVRNVKATAAYPIPPSPLADPLWVVEPLSCVVTGVDHCALKIGDRLALVGAGFMGLLLVQCLGRSFADELLVFDVDPARLTLAQEFGATEVYNPTAPDFEAQLQALADRPIDCVVDAAGAQAGLDLSTRLVRRGGRLNYFGWIHGRASFSCDDWHGKGITVVCSSPSSRIRDPFPVAIRLIEQGYASMEKVVTHVVPLDGMAALLEGVTSKQTKGYIKGVVTLD